MTETAASLASPFLRHRVSVSAMFLLNGMMVGGWAPAIPPFKDKHGLGESELGLMILLIGVGSLITMPVTGALIARRGSTGVLQVAAALCTILLPLALFAPSIALAIGALLLFGGGLGAMDVSMNANAVRVEAHYAKPILSSCHGFWSVGALIGAGGGSVMLGQLGLAGLAGGVFALMLVGTALALPNLMADRVEQGEGIEKPKLALPRSLALYVIAMVALAGFTAEGAILDWAALYLRDERDIPASMAGYAFAAFSAMMALVRFAGDPIRTRLGDQRMLRYSGIIAAVGFLIAGLWPSLTGSLIGFAIVGLGLANVVPIAFAAADRVPGVPRGIGISIATACGYAGLLVAPPLIGFVAEVTSFAVIFAWVSLLPLYALFAAWALGQGSTSSTSTRVG
ncbi:MAG: MFS transporter [Cohaesibacteraceae bacterium]